MMDIAERTAGREAGTQEKMAERHTYAPAGVRVEVVTSTFVASGVPEGVHDLGRFLENLNNPTLSRHIELQEAAVRPLYRAGQQLQLDASVLVRRDEIIFANFEGPHYTRGLVQAPKLDATVLLLAPPFQLQGVVGFEQGADAAMALRAATHGFFVMRGACVYDADGNELGEGEQIIVNGAMVQMTSATRKHIPAVGSKPRATIRALDASEDATVERAA